MDVTAACIESPARTRSTLPLKVAARLASESYRSLMSNVPPPHGWFPDPTGRHQHRYYDGVTWTDGVSDNGRASHDPLIPLTSTQLHEKVNRRNRIVVIVMAVLALVVVAGIIGNAVTKKDDPGDNLTLTDAACKMLNEGNTEAVTLQTMRQLASTRRDVFDDPAEAARLAVASARARGCG